MNESKFNPKNEKLKIKYEEYLTKLAKEKVKPDTAKAKLGSIRIYDELNKHEDYKCFDEEHGVAFYEYLRELESGASTRIKHLTNLREFLGWYFDSTKVTKAKKLALQSLEPTEEDKRLAKRTVYRDIPTDEEIEKLINLPITTSFDRMCQALIAFLLITAARISAVATTTLECIDVEKHIYLQDPLGGIKTKRDKYIVTRFMEYDERFVNIVLDWIDLLKTQYGFSPESPLFPKVRGYLEGEEIKRVFYGDNKDFANLIAKICQKVGIRVYNPHEFRHYAILRALRFVNTGVQIKALSQNVGHNDIDTILEQYANMKPERYVEIIEGMFAGNVNEELQKFSTQELLQELLRREQAIVRF